jgi:hypothetical protein
VAAALNPTGMRGRRRSQRVESTRRALLVSHAAHRVEPHGAHVRTDLTIRIRRSALPPLPVHVQAAALLGRGLAPTGRFHIQLTASTSRAGSDELLYRMTKVRSSTLGSLSPANQPSQQVLPSDIATAVLRSCPDKL